MCRGHARSRHSVTSLPLSNHSQPTSPDLYDPVGPLINHRLVCSSQLSLVPSSLFAPFSFPLLSSPSQSDLLSAKPLTFSKLGNSIPRDHHRILLGVTSKERNLGFRRVLLELIKRARSERIGTDEGGLEGSPGVVHGELGACRGLSSTLLRRADGHEMIATERNSPGTREVRGK